MKRQRYEIKTGGKQVAVKFAWNSAWRGIADLVRDIALAELQTYSLIEKATTKDDDGNHFIGFQIWQGEQTGSQIKFEVERLEEGEQ